MVYSGRSLCSVQSYIDRVKWLPLRNQNKYGRTVNTRYVIKKLKIKKKSIIDLLLIFLVDPKKTSKAIRELGLDRRQ